MALWADSRLLGWGGGHPGTAARRYLQGMADEGSAGSSCRAAVAVLCKSNHGFCSPRLFPAAQWEIQRGKGNPACLKTDRSSRTRKGELVITVAFPKSVCFLDDPSLHSFSKNCGLFKMPCTGF